MINEMIFIQEKVGVNALKKEILKKDEKDEKFLHQVLERNPGKALFFKIFCPNGRRCLLSVHFFL